MAARLPARRASGRPSAATARAWARPRAARGVTHFLVDEQTVTDSGGAPSAGVDGRRHGRRRGAAGPGGHQPDLVLALGLPHRRGVPRLPRPRAVHRRAPVGHHRAGRAPVGQGAVRPGGRGRAGAPRRGARSSPRSPTGCTGCSASAAGRAWSSRRTTPSCSGTGGTRDRRSWARPSVPCVPPASPSPPSSGPWPTGTSRGRWSSAPARGAPARTSRCGTARRCPPSSRTTLRCNGAGCP